MDQSEVIRMVSTFNSRWVLSERRLTKCQQELTEVRQSLSQTNRDLDEIAKLAEVLWETNRRLGVVTDYLVKRQGMEDGNREPKSFDTMFNWVAVEAGLSFCAGENGDTAAAQNMTNDASAGAEALLQMSNQC